MAEVFIAITMSIFPTVQLTTVVGWTILAGVYYYLFREKRSFTGLVFHMNYNCTLHDVHGNSILPIISTLFLSY